MGHKRKNKKQQAIRKSMLSGITTELHPEGNLKDTAIITIRDVIIGVIAGGATGAAIGRSSLLIGAGVAGIGHYKKIPLATIFGIGMMAANGFQNGSSVKGIKQDVLEAAKERLKAYKLSFQEKLYLDKILKKKEGVAGMGAVQYFTYPLSNQAGKSNVQELDMNALDKIEEHIRQNAEDFANKTQVSGMKGNDWVEDKNY